MNSLFLLVLLLPLLTSAVADCENNCFDDNPNWCYLQDNYCNLPYAVTWLNANGGGEVWVGLDSGQTITSTMTISEYIKIKFVTTSNGNWIVKLNDSSERLFIIDDGAELEIYNPLDPVRQSKLIFQGTSHDTGGPGVSYGGLFKVLNGGTLTFNCQEYSTAIPNCKVTEGEATNKGGAINVVDGGTLNMTWVHFRDNDDIPIYYQGSSASNLTAVKTKWQDNADGDLHYTNIATSATSFCQESCSGSYTYYGTAPSLTSSA